jgi:hypothetical protein
MTRRVVVFFLAAATLLVAAPSWAQEPVPISHAIQLGLRAGYGVPFGKTGRTVAARCRSTSTML